MTPNKSSKFAIKKQVATRLLRLPAQTAQSIFNQYTTPFQIDPSSNLILHHPLSSEKCIRQSFTPPQLVVRRRQLLITIPP